MFLTMAVHRTFDQKSDRLAEATVTYFKPNGVVVVEKKDYASKRLNKWETTADVSGNWECIPAFGSYESLSRLER